MEKKKFKNYIGDRLKPNVFYYTGQTVTKQYVISEVARTKKHWLQLSKKYISGIETFTANDVFQELFLYVADKIDDDKLIKLYSGNTLDAYMKTILKRLNFKSTPIKEKFNRYYRFLDSTVEISERFDDINSCVEMDLFKEERKDISKQKFHRILDIVEDKNSNILTMEQRHLFLIFHFKPGMNAYKLGKIIGVSASMVYTYLKEINEIILKEIS